VTDQRNRVTTDPGLGPVGVEHPTTLRSMAAARPVAEDEDHGAPVYYEPKPLNAVSDHKTLELQTVKISEDIDPRKLPTELKLRRPVLHVLPASDPNWPAPSAPSDAGWPPPQFDSGWPPPETVLTTSQPPLAARRRSFVSLVLLVLLCATLVLLIGLNMRRWSARSAASAQHAQAATLSVASQTNKLEALPSKVEVPSTVSADGESASASNASALEPAAESATSASASAEAAAGAASARPADAPHHAPLKPIPPSPSTANSRTLSAPPTAKPKRAIY